MEGFKGFVWLTPPQWPPSRGSHNSPWGPDNEEQLQVAMQVKCTTNIFQLPQLVYVSVVSSQQKLHLQQLECLGIFKNIGSSQFPTHRWTLWCPRFQKGTLARPTPPSGVPSPRRSQSFAKPSVGRPFSLGNPLRNKTFLTSDAIMMWKWDALASKWDASSCQNSTVTHQRLSFLIPAIKFQQTCWVV